MACLENASAPQNYKYLSKAIFQGFYIFIS